MRLFQNKSAFWAPRGKSGLRELQRKTEKRSSHRRSGTTKRFLAGKGILLLKDVDSEGKASKEIIYSQLPHSDVACIFESTQKRSRGRRAESGKKAAQAGAVVTEQWQECLLKGGARQSHAVPQVPCGSH